MADEKKGESKIKTFLACAASVAAVASATVAVLNYLKGSHIWPFNHGSSIIDDPSSVFDSVVDSSSGEADDSDSSYDSVIDPKDPSVTYEDRDFTLSEIGTIAKPAAFSYFKDYSAPFLCYDPDKECVYYLDGNQVVCYVTGTGKKNTVCDLSGVGNADGLLRNPYTGALYAVLNASSDMKQAAKLYSVDSQSVVIQSLHWTKEGGYTTYCGFFSDADTLYLTSGTDSAAKCSLSAGTCELLEYGSNGYFELGFLFRNGDVNRWCFVDSNLAFRKANCYVTESRGFLPAETFYTNMTNLTDDERIKIGMCQEYDGFCWMDDERNIYHYNAGAKRSEVLVYGNHIVEASTLSEDIPAFLRIDNKRFVLYDLTNEKLLQLTAN